MTKQSRRRRSELERLIDRTVLEPTHPDLGACWRFTGTATPYGRIAKAQDSYTHRLGWKLLRGPIPEGMELHHRCKIYACWNPDHLELVTHAENLAFERRSHCKHGHPLSGENLRIDPRTKARVCRLCVRESQQRFRAAAKRRRQEDSGPLGRPGRPKGGSRRTTDLERLLDFAPSLDKPILCWAPAGCSAGQRIHMVASTMGRRGLPTGWAGSGCEAQFPMAWSSTTYVASTRAGIRTTLSSSPMRRTWPSRLRHSASTGIHFRVPTFGSTHGQVHGSAEHATRPTSKPIANAGQG